ncbi:unnamed protein product [Vitrella brassicaformis CCMP3155]|uniref:WAP domain-containing protein n=1 Tax=Vitrella brassicaformis (strain CCMP3155) TaxID=1169540 RepID=A0A0G4FMP9_VITBC|nr:unnamed protein product [Vitrella brassicaformis CCMP3155]|eukprot:CEM15507.1 unnamed protein product [Vitrella brassicaformis CCMP3155]
MSPTSFWPLWMFIPLLLWQQGGEPPVVVAIMNAPEKTERQGSALSPPLPSPATRGSAPRQGVMTQILENTTVSSTAAANVSMVAHEAKGMTSANASDDSRPEVTVWMQWKTPKSHRVSSAHGEGHRAPYHCNTTVQECSVDKDCCSRVCVDSGGPDMRGFCN